ncbi:MAG: LicD family protein [Bacteroidales bacterium]|nr:LicD family protein [Bacteroidales bacterium]
MADPDIRHIEDIHIYLQQLVELKEEIVIISVKDTTGYRLTEEISTELNNIGVINNLVGKHNNSFVSVTKGGSSLFESLNMIKSTFHSFEFNGHVFYVNSKIYSNGNKSTIAIDDKDYSVNLRGLNIVIFDAKNDEVVDSVCFDTHVAGIECHRLPAVGGKVAYRHFSVFDEIVSVEQKIDSDYVALDKHITKLENALSRLSSLIEVKSNHNQFLNLMNYKLENEDYNAASRRLFMNLPKAKGDLRTLQIASSLLLRDFDRVCKENGVQYWVNHGTLLGAVRHKGFIPWDDDMDVGMTRADVLKLQEILCDDENYSLNEHYSIHYGPHHVYNFSYRGKAQLFRIDIFVWDYTSAVSEAAWQKQVDARKKLCDAVHNYAVQNKIPLKTAIKDQACLDFIEDSFNKNQPNEFKCSQKNAKGLVWAIDNVSVPRGNFCYSMGDFLPTVNVEFEGFIVQAPQKYSLVLERQYGDYYSFPDDMFSHKHNKIDEMRVKGYEEVISKYKGSY